MTTLSAVTSAASDAVAAAAAAAVAATAAALDDDQTYRGTAQIIHIEYLKSSAIKYAYYIFKL